MEKKFRREIDSLDEIFDFADDFFSAHDINEDIAFSMRLVVEELFTNLVRHNVGGRDHILIRLDKDSSQLILQLKDFDVEPVTIPEPKIDIHQSLDERRIGGLGIHLVKSVVDTLTYEHKNGTLCVTAIKNVEDEDV